MRITWSYAVCMSNVQIRNVPEDLHRKLRIRAASEGSTVSDLLLRELERWLARPSKHEVLARIAGRDPVELSESSADSVRDGRPER